MSRMMNRRGGRWLAGLAVATVMAAGVVVLRAASSSDTGSTQPTASSSGQAEQLLQAARNRQVVEGKLDEAIKLYREVVAKYPQNHAVAARALVALGQCYEKLGATQTAEARKAYEEIVNRYSDQADAVTQARARLAALGGAASGRAAGPVMRRLPIEAGSFGRPSPAGRLMVTFDANMNLAVGEIAGGPQRSLPVGSSLGSKIQVPSGPLAMSPDEQSVAYVWFNADTTEDLRIIAADGMKPPRVLVRASNERGAGVAWMPDGQAIVTSWVSEGGGSEIKITRIASGETQVLRTFPAGRSIWRDDGPRGLAPSPDGRWIAYDLRQDGETWERDVFLLDAVSGADVPVVRHAAHDRVVGWSPDGTRLIFVSDRGGALALYGVPVAGGHASGSVTLLRPALGDFESFSLTRNGELYLTLPTERSDVFVAEIDFASGAVVKPPASVNERRIGGRTFPSFSPDGRSLFYRVKRDPEPAVLARLDLATKRESAVPAKLVGFSAFRAVTGGQWLAVSGTADDGRRGQFRVDAQTGETTLVLPARPGRGSVSAASWLDGQTLLYLRHQPNPAVRLVMAHNVESGAERELARVPMPDWVPDISGAPDGTRVAFVNERSSKEGLEVAELSVVPAAGGAPFVAHRVEGVIRAVAWTADSRSLVYILQKQASKARPEPAGEPELWIVPAAGGKARKMAVHLPQIDQLGQLSVHPDGRRVAFTAGQGKSEVWVLENFLPAKK